MYLNTFVTNIGIEEVARRQLEVAWVGKANEEPDAEHAHKFDKLGLVCSLQNKFQLVTYYCEGASNGAYLDLSLVLSRNRFPLDFLCSGDKTALGRPFIRRQNDSF